MAEILGIVASFLGAATELGKCIAAPIKRQFNYLCCFSNNIQSLRDEARTLKAARDGLQTRVDTDVNNAQVVNSGVQDWLDDVTEIQGKLNEIEAEITTAKNGGFRSRFSLSKKAKKTAEAMKELRQSCNFSVVSHPPPPPALIPIPLGSTYEFESRKHIEDQIMANLRDNGTNMVGICGMGGVGKTTMAKRIMHRVREEHLFEEIVMAVVSQKVDMLGIQGDVAKYLGLVLNDKESLSSRAHDLRARLRGKKRTLLVLDDIWENLKLEDLGISCDNGCKVLLTSRDSDTFKRMSVEKVHAVRVLSDTEAWDLFRSKVGSCIEQQNVVSVARQVMEECKGLPIALVTVGVALRDEVNLSRWKAALHQLKRSNPRHIPGVLEDVYRPLRFSYESLKNGEEKSLFLLCCLFPEDFDIPIDDLPVYAMGLRMCEDITSLERARETVCSLVERLKSCFLLLEGEDENHVKMHDVVRDVAIFIASEEKRINCNDCTWISPNVGERRIGGFPNLQLLMIDRESRDKEVEINDDFFQGMRELNVFSIECSSLQQLPQTTKLLTNLRTLVLDSCESLESISVVGELVNLEILICRWCESIESLPTEIGRLSGLRLLELTDCDSLETIPPGIISNLKGLEELIVEDFDKWEAEVMETERKNASLSELQHLSTLTRLYINIKNSRLAAQQMQLPPNITKYGIAIGNKMSYQPYKFDKKMKLKLPGNISLGKWIHEFVGSVECMYLEGDGSRSLDFGLAHNMRSLTFENCSTVKKLVDVTTSATVFPVLEILQLENLSELEEICDINGSMQSNSFNNLNQLSLRRLPALQHLWKSSIGPGPCNLVVSIFNQLSSICIAGCNKLHTLFSFPVMESGCFLQLERLEIEHCHMMKQVLWWNKEEENQTNIHVTQVFPKLKLLSLKSLPRLMSFSKGTESIAFPLLEEMNIYNCPMLKSFGGDDDSLHLFCKQDKVKFCNCLKVFKFEPHGYNETWRDLCPQIPSDFFVGLRELKVAGFANMQSLFSLSMTTSGCVLQLEKLEIESCKMMEQLLLSNDKENQIRLVFPKLKVLILKSLERLMNFSKGIESIEFPLLEEINIYYCPLLTSFVATVSPNDHDDGGRDSIHIFCKSNKVNFGCLKVVELKVDGDYEMRRNWCPQIPADVFTGLHRLKVCGGYKGMKSLFPVSTTASSCLLQLEQLEIESCDMMEHVFLWNEEEDKQSNIDITVAFPKLKFLSLKSLPRLVSFSNGIVSIEFPQLEHMSINNCPLLESFVSTPKDHDDDDFIHLLFKSNKIKFGCLKLLALELDVRDQYDEMRRNWCSQIPIDFFTGIRELKVSGYQGTKSLCSLSMTPNIFFLQLRRLVIERCDSMEQVFLWNDEENQRRNDIKLVFPKLEYLILQSLPRLKSFTRGIQTIEFPLLLEMKIYNCPLLDSLLDSFVSTKSSDDHDDGDHASMHFSYKAKTKLNVHYENAMMRNWWHQIDFFAGIRELKVSGFKSWKSLFSFSITESGRCLLQLKKLEIYSCDMMEQVILWNEEESQTHIHMEPLFPKLKSLILNSLPRLRSFSKGIKSNDFLVPARIRITNCPLLRSCDSSSSTDASIHLFCKPHKVESGSLKELQISGFDEMRRNWCPQIPTIDLFAGVCKLYISMLKGMKSLFPCSIARNLRNLRRLDISECEEMVKVIEDDACCVETQTPPNPLFPNLEYLNLSYLEKLKSICEWRCGLHELPNLISLYIYRCRVMEEFTSGHLNAPRLEEIEIDGQYFSGEEVNNALQLYRLKIEAITTSSHYLFLVQTRSD